MLQKEPTQPTHEHAEPVIEYGEVYSYFAAHNLHLGDVESSQAGRDQYGPMLIQFVVEKTSTWIGTDPATSTVSIPAQTLQGYFADFENGRREAKSRGLLAAFNTEVRSRYERTAHENVENMPTIAVALALKKGLRDTEAADIAQDIVVALGMYCRVRAEQAHDIVAQRTGSVVLNGEVAE